VNLEDSTVPERDARSHVKTTGDLEKIMDMGAPSSAAHDGSPSTVHDIVNSMRDDRVEDAAHFVQELRLARGMARTGEVLALLNISETKEGLREIMRVHGLGPLLEQMVYNMVEDARSSAQRIYERLVHATEVGERGGVVIVKTLTSILNSQQLTARQHQLALTALATFVFASDDNCTSLVSTLGATDAIVPSLGADDAEVRRIALVIAHKLCTTAIGASVRIEACGGGELLLRTLASCSGEHEKATALDLLLLLPGGRYKLGGLTLCLLRLQGLVLPPE
jgi:hypothetical protein